VAHAKSRADRIELGNIDVERDFSDVRGVAEAYARLVAEPGAIGGTFNICSGEGRSLRSIIEMAEAISGHRMQISVNPAFVRPNEVSCLYGSNKRLLQLVGDLNMPPFDDTLRWMIER
jgi:nucleoside-diphosphate-sugar epimerase